MPNDLLWLGVEDFTGVDLYLVDGRPRNDAEAVAHERRRALLHDASSWAIPQQGDDTAVWFATTGKGFDLYRAENNWAS